MISAANNVCVVMFSQCYTLSPQLLVDFMSFGGLQVSLMGAGLYFAELKVITVFRTLYPWYCAPHHSVIKSPFKIQGSEISTSWQTMAIITQKREATASGCQPAGALCCMLYINPGILHLILNTIGS